MNWFVEPWTYPFMRWALLCCLVLSGIHVYMGYHIVRRGVLFVDLAMAQAAALGAAVAIVLGLEHDTPGEYAVSLVFALGSAVFFALVRSSRVQQEAIVATFYSLVAAATFVVLDRSPHGMEEIKHLFVGQVLTSDPGKIVMTGLVYVVIGAAHWFMHARTSAVTEGRSRARRDDVFFFGTFALVVTSSVGLAGVLLVFALLVLPAVAAIQLSDHLLTRLLWGWAIAGFSSLSGLHIAYYQDLPAAPVIILNLGLFLVLAVFTHGVLVPKRQ